MGWLVVSTVNAPAMHPHNQEQITNNHTRIFDHAEIEDWCVGSVWGAWRRKKQADGWMWERE